MNYFINTVTASCKSSTSRVRWIPSSRDCRLPEDGAGLNRPPAQKRRCQPRKPSRLIDLNLSTSTPSCLSTSIELIMSKLRILVPVKRVIDYAVGVSLLNWLFNCFHSTTECIHWCMNCRLTFSGRSSPESTRPKRPSRPPTLSTR